jgi:exosortase
MAVPAIDKNGSAVLTAGPRPLVWPALSRTLLGLVLVEIVILYLPTLRWLIDRWTMSVWHNGHGMFTAMLVTFIVWRQLRDAKHLPVTSCAWGFVFIIPALILRAFDAAMHTQLLAAVSLVLILPGLSLLFLGTKRTKLIAFPLAFAALMLPIPLALTESLQMRLRELTTLGAAAVIPRLGVPVFSEGTTLFLPGAHLLVSDACSGFSTLYAAMVVASLTAYSTTSVWRRILVMIAAPPIAVAANIVRVSLLSLLVNWQGVDVLATSLHPASGILTFVVALPIIFWLGGTSKPAEARA